MKQWARFIGLAGAAMLLCAGLSGCVGGAAAIPLAVAQYGMTAYQGYDIACDYAPRERIDYVDPALDPADRILQRRLRERLGLDRELAEARIGLWVFDQNVYLVGAANSRQEVDRATHIAENAEGTRAVYRYIAPIKPGKPTPEDSFRLREKIIQRMKTDSTDGRTVAVAVAGRTVVILGRVDSEQSRDALVETARSTSGVRRVVAHLAVRPPQPDAPAASTTSSAPTSRQPALFRYSQTSTVGMWSAPAA